MPQAPPAHHTDALADEEHDFDAIEAAVLETPRGRWFMHEFARRMTAAENERVFVALGRIERMLVDAKASAGQTPHSAAPVKPAPEPTGHAADLRFAVRLVQLRLMDLAAGMRAGGVDEHFCAQIEQQARTFVEVASGRPPREAEPVAAPHGALASVSATRPPVALAARGSMALAAPDIVTLASANPLMPAAPADPAGFGRIVAAPQSSEPEPQAAAPVAPPQRPLPTHVQEPPQVGPDGPASSQSAFAPPDQPPPALAVGREFDAAFPAPPDVSMRPRVPLEPLIQRLPPTSVRFTKAPIVASGPALHAIQPPIPSAPPAQAPAPRERAAAVAAPLEQPSGPAPVAEPAPVAAPSPPIPRATARLATAPPPVNRAAFAAIDAMAPRERSALFV